MPELLDDNGRRVISFASRIRNLGRVAELTDAVIDIAVSGAWRDYHVATGHEAWREAELDYFLIACDMHCEDVARVLAYNKQAKDLAPMMDRNANGEMRRPLTEAAAQWHSPIGESLTERAARLGWTRTDGHLRNPIPERARAKAKHGMTFEQHASRTRTQRIPAERRRELDQLVRHMLAEIASDAERRYLIDRLGRDNAGRPTTSSNELGQWATDAERLDWDTAALAEHWGVARRSAQERVRRLRNAKQEGAT